MPEEVAERRRSESGQSPINTIVSVYLLIGFLIGIYRAFLVHGTLVLTLNSLVLDIVTVLLYMLLWPFFLYGGLQFRIT
jgi:hypothetical protein